MHAFHWKNGKLYAEEVSVDRLAAAHGTPLYVYSKGTVLGHYERLMGALEGLEATVAYAVKANSNLAVLSILARAGSGFDIVSGGELFRVLQAGGDPGRCTFAGVGKTREEIEFALDQRIYAFIVESEAELKFIDEVARRRKKKARVAVRVNPNVDAGTHQKITTGTYENKFGIAFEEVEKLYARANRLKHVKLHGVHMHIGSQITSVEPFRNALRKMVPLVDRLRNRFGLEFFDIGGGLGIVYDPALASGQEGWWTGRSRRPLTVEDYARGVVPLVQPLGMKIVVEPGRLIAGNAGILVARVLYVKKTARKNFVIVDAAMNDLIRPSFYDAYHEIVPVRIQGPRRTVKTDVVGPVCESGDVFCKDRVLPELVAGDLIAFLSAGAYGFTMASNYNSRPRAAEVLVAGKTALLARRRESLQDLIRGESTG
ncbi:MAG: diaminopimelate decarboxylase [Verrucomicrobiia bacterium]